MFALILLAQIDNIIYCKLINNILFVTAEATFCQLLCKRGWNGNRNRFLREWEGMEVKLDGDGYKIYGDGWGWM